MTIIFVVFLLNFIAGFVRIYIYIIAIGSHDVLHVQVAAPQKLLEANGKQGPGLNPGLQRIRAQSSGFLEWAMA